MTDLRDTPGAPDWIAKVAAAARHHGWVEVTVTAEMGGDLQELLRSPRLPPEPSVESAAQTLIKAIWRGGCCGWCGEFTHDVASDCEVGELERALAAGVPEEGAGR